ncbi:acyl-CoA thioesterase [Rhodohalobacter sulfatireducens]|jgi:acyl-CoA thioester hydrolase|uniref:Acyl-CoA thioesterase n=1 Tax=Rhodohalobacter sulfatireducens TaxID=2911366 RepID=A0ABS9KC17_9BACT|nr:thioesterase family protein [Rhodohalobacter sulfatireducens]MCG2588399.1 acyl-CoA thioesterase [Rhodohalobacter sulfatireducens]NBC03494.1 YbgC/FadM family acyl-CoA thioesterase [Bacteroidota bacterium]
MIRFPETKPIIRFNYELRSRYGETDQMGYVYYGRYLEYFEVARTEMIRSLGIPYSRLEEDGFMLPVVYAQLEYKAPIHYDELMTIEVSVFEKPMVRLDTFYRVLTSRLEKPHVLGQVTLCFTDTENRRPCRAPDYFNDLIDQQS